MSNVTYAALIIALAVLVVLSGFFSATETAYTSFSAVRMRRFARTKNTARTALKLSEDYNKILTTLLIGNNIVNIAASTIGTVLFVSVLGEGMGATVSTIVITVVVLIFGEVTPKTLAKELPEKFACFAAWPLRILSYVLWPLNWIFSQWEKFIFFAFHLNKPKEKYTEAEFKMLVSDVHEDGVINETEHELIHRTLRFDELTVGNCMVPLDRVTSVGERDNTRAVQRIFREKNFSRVPVWKGDRRHIVGILYRADFYENLLARKKDYSALIRPISVTDVDEKVSVLLKRMQKAREHMMVVNGKDGAVGIITREDIIEELLGDLDDKYDMTPVTSPLNPCVPEPEDEDEDEGGSEEE